MAPKKILQRLLRLRAIEEEQSRLELEAAMREQSRAQQQVALAGQELARGQAHFVEGIAIDHGATRAGGLMETEQARLRQTALKPRLAAAAEEAEQKRAMFMMNWTRRRQVETLVRESEQAAAHETGKRAQQMLDDWYGRRARRDTAAREAMVSARLGPLKTPEGGAEDGS